MLGSRDWRKLLFSPFKKQNYVAVFNMAIIYPNFINNFIRYVFGVGNYPYDIQVRTPLGIFAPRIFSHHDLLTVNEVFCRCDYFADKNIRTVVDIGSNIGISALYFLTRNYESMCFLYEPDERNTAKLRDNLLGFEDRFHLAKAAVSYESGRLDFGIEPSGRYGGIGVQTGKSIIVDCLNINDVIEKALITVELIDILKIDTEGLELRTVEAIDPALASRIKRIYLEAQPDRYLLPNLFWQRQYGSICQLENKHT